MKHLMVDIETLSTKKNAYIISIAYGIYDDETDERSEIKMLNIDDDDEQTGCHLDHSTVLWWLRRPRSTLESITRPNCESLYEALTELDNVIHDNKIDKVWANSPSFDCDIINNAAERELGHTIIPYFSQLDVRTARELVGRTYTENAHNPMEDVRVQLDDVIKFLKLRKNNE